MLTRTAATESHENSRHLLRSRAKALFVESEIHSIIDCLRESISGAETQSGPIAISSTAVNSIAGLDLLLKVCDDIVS
jgi:hypothetical protein